MTELDFENVDGGSSGEEMDSDEELQEALASGLLKPGLNHVGKVQKKKFANNVSGLKEKLQELEKGCSLPWIERLDLRNKAAPLAPELALQEQQHLKQREKIFKMNKIGGDVESGDPVHNDFKREMLFYRQAQSAVLEAIPRLKSIKIPTKRPEDYFAQMAKSDSHMNKIREKLVSKQVSEERIEKIRKLRDLRKYGKKVQVEVQQKRQKEKREMLDQVKKFRAGETDTFDFLQDNNGKKKSSSVKAQQKKAGKDKKFGFGGKKKGSKMNDKESFNDVSSIRGRYPKKATQGKNKRPGKGKRKSMKSKK